jgi:hypothetical protein
MALRRDRERGSIRRLIAVVLLPWFLPSWAAPAARPATLALVASTASSGATTAGRLVVPVNDPLELAVGGGSLWVTTPRQLIRVDPLSGRVVARIALPATAGAIAVAGNRVWVATNPIITSPGLSARGSVRIAVHAAKFAYVPVGWKTFDRDFALLHRRGADVESYALSWAYTPNSLGWASRMPPNAIGVHVILIRRSPTNPTANLCGQTPHLPNFPLIRRFPLVLPHTTAATQEGEPNIPEYRVFGRFDDFYNIDLRVDINRVHPTPAMLQLAQHVVSGLRFPRWPLSTDC